MKPIVTAALKADSGLAALVSTRIYADYPDQFTTLPVVSYRELDKRGVFYTDNEETAREYYFVVDVWSKGSTSDVADAVEVIMKSLDFTLQSAPDLYETDTKIRHKPMTFKTKRIY